MPPTLSEWAQYMLIAAKSEDAKLQQLSESLREGSAQLAKSRLVGISGQSLPVLMGSRMIDVLWSGHVGREQIFKERRSFLSTFPHRLNSKDLNRKRRSFRMKQKSN